jgi:hypothetical protein
MVRVPDHPRASLGYVFEHILVAEELIGRYLLEGESVHHVNGLRDDGRRENLELWTRPQPSGIRVSDAAVWARDILDRYVGAGAPPTVLADSREQPPITLLAPTMRGRGPDRPIGTAGTGVGLDRLPR